MSHCIRARMRNVLILSCLWAIHGARGDFEPEFEHEFDADPPPNYWKIDKNNAAWNVTLMRYLNFKENDLERNLNTSICIRLSNRFAFTATPPYGFCEAEDGTGTENFLILGDGLALNLGRVVYEAFKKHADEFNIFALKDCDPMVTERRDRYCKDNVNYTDLLHKLEPDVIFVLSRSLAARDALKRGAKIEDDPVFEEYLDRLREMETIAKKVYILQALPTLDPKKYYLVHTVTPTRRLRNRLIVHNDSHARRRIAELKKRCQKCEIIDLKAQLRDHKGRYWGLDPKINLMLIDQWNLLTRFGRVRTKTVFQRLSKKFTVPKSDKSDPTIQ